MKNLTQPKAVPQEKESSGKGVYTLKDLKSIEGADNFQLILSSVQDDIQTLYDSLGGIRILLDGLQISTPGAMDTVSQINTLRLLGFHVYDSCGDIVKNAKFSKVDL